MVIAPDLGFSIQVLSPLSLRGLQERGEIRVLPRFGDQHMASFMVGDARLAPRRDVLLRRCSLAPPATSAAPVSSGLARAARSPRPPPRPSPTPSPRPRRGSTETTSD